VFIRRASTAQTTVDLISVLEGEHIVTKLYRMIQVKFRRAIHQGIEAKLHLTIQVKFRRVIQAILHQVTPATIRNDSFKLIDTLASEGGALCSEGAHPAPTI